MKKWIICLTLLTALLLTACGGETPAPTEAAEEPTQLHTVAPSQAQPEAEWASVAVQMTLEDNDNVYAKGSDFLSFALIGSSDSAEIRFKLDDVTAAMLRQQDPGNKYYVTIDGKKIGDVTLNQNCNELTLIGDFTYSKLCTLANRIRGLE